LRRIQADDHRGIVEVVVVRWEIENGERAAVLKG